MKTSRLTVLGCVLGLCAGTVAAEQPAPPALAVLTFEGGPKGDATGEIVADLLSGHLARGATVVERKDLRLLLAEHALNLSGAVGPTEAVRVGQLTGAGLIVTGRLFRFGPDAFATVRVVGVATGRLKGVNVRVPGDLDPDEVAARVARELLQELPAIAREVLSEPASGAADPARPVGAAGRGDLAAVAVLNFENAGGADPSRDWLRKGLADLVIGDLAGLGVRVVSREQMQEMVRELQLRKANDDPRAVARVLKASRCIHGTFQVDGDEATLRATLLNVSRSKPLHNAVATGPAVDLIAVQKRLSAELAEVLKGERAGTIDPAKLPRWTEDLKASQLLYKGIDLFDQGRYLDAWGLFRRALRQDPSYADASYWAGRMMYYEQEHHQARLDLTRFVARNLRHPRVGDAVMEIINSAQLTAGDAGDVLDVLSAAGRLAPRAEVPNQFGAGNSSTVGLYAAGLAAQILRDQDREREAFTAYADQIGAFPITHPLYWIAWHEMFALKVEHLRATGEPLTMPPTPPLLNLPGGDAPRTRKTPDGRVEPLLPWNDEKAWLSPGGLHPNGETLGASYYGGTRLGGDSVRHQEFVPLTPEEPSVVLDFSADPLAGPAAAVSTFTRYFHAGPDDELTGFDVEVRYRPEPEANQVVRVEGDVKPLTLSLEPSGVARHFLPLRPGTRASGLRLTLRRGRTTTAPSKSAAVTSWKMTGRFRRADAPVATLVLRAPDDIPFTVALDGAELPTVEGTARVERVGPGRHVLDGYPRIVGRHGHFRTAVTLDAGEEVEVALAAEIDPKQRDEPYQPWWTREIGAPRDAFRLGPDMGAGTNQAGNVHVFEDRRGRWLVVWSLRRDLYLAVSDDRGATWADAVKLPAPVNSAHDERLPTLAQDSEGRYVLAFASDRNLEHAHSAYVCWSDDLVNFSAPARIAPGLAEPARIVPRSDGTYLVYMNLLGFEAARPVPMFAGLKECWGVSTSPDLVRWSSPVEIFPPTGNALDVIEENGRFLALAGTSLGSHPTVPGTHGTVSEVASRVSADGVHFSEPKTIPVSIRHDRSGRALDVGVHVSQVVFRRAGGRLLAMAHGLAGEGAVLRWSGDGAWEQIAHHGGQFPNVGLSGDFLLSEDALWFFSQPRRSLARQGSMDFPTHARWSSEADPILMNFYRYRWSDPKAGDDAPTPPGPVTAEVVRRTPAAAAEKAPEPQPVKGEP